MEVTSKQAWASVKNILNEDPELFFYLALYLFLSLVPIPMYVVKTTDHFTHVTNATFGFIHLFTGIVYLSFLYICLKHAIAYTTLQRLQNKNATPLSTLIFIFKHLVFILKITVLVAVYQSIELALRAYFRDRDISTKIALDIVLGIADVFTSAFISLLIPIAILENDFQLKTLKYKAGKIAKIFDGHFGWGPLNWFMLIFFLLMVIVLIVVSETYQSQLYNSITFMSTFLGMLIIGQFMDLCLSIYMSHLAFKAFNNPKDKYHLKK